MCHWEGLVWQGYILGLSWNIHSWQLEECTSGNAYSKDARLEHRAGGTQGTVRRWRDVDHSCCTRDLLFPVWAGSRGSTRKQHMTDML